MHVDIFLSVISGLSITILIFLGWLTRLTVTNGTKFDHLQKKIEQKIDMMIASNTTLMKSHDDRIARLEKYFDVIMQTQIKKNEEQLKMEF